MVNGLQIKRIATAFGGGLTRYKETVLNAMFLFFAVVIVVVVFVFAAAKEVVGVSR